MKREQKSGTTVIATQYEQNNAITTPSASAVDTYLLTPVSNATGKKTMAVLQVAARTANWTSFPPFSAASTLFEPISKCRKMFSTTTTELSMSRDSANAMPPSTIVLMESPNAFRIRKVAIQEIGIDSITATVARTLPRKSRIIRPVRQRPMAPSLMTFLIAVLTKTDWSKTTLVFRASGMSSKWAVALRTPLTMVIVLESPPCLRIGI